MTSRRICLAIIAGITMSSGACTNALYFYETGKVSLTLEGRPDSTEPVQGNLGFKQRTAVVAPGKSTESGESSDSGSMISSFRFGNKEKISVRTALITGQAARCLEDPEAQRAARVVAEAAPIPAYSELATSSITRANESGKLARLIELTQKPFSALSAEQRTELGQLTGVGDAYNAQLHAAIADTLGE